LENLKAQKLLNKIQRDLIRNGIITNTLIADLKELRTHVVEEGDPLLAKTIRLTYEHLETYKDFNIAIPDDEPIEDSEIEVQNDEVRGKESLDYLLSLMADTSNKINELELREYIDAFNSYSEEN